MKHQKGFSSALLIFIVIFGLAASFFYLGTLNGNLFKYLRQSKPDTSLDWKSFTEANENYSIEYPPDWIVERSDKDNVKYVNLWVGKEDSEDSTLLQIRTKPETYKNVEDFKTRQTVNIKANFTDPIKYEEYMIGEKKGYRLMNGTALYVFVYNSSTQKIQEFIGDTNSSSKKLVSEIISTFKFTQSNTAAPTTSSANGDTPVILFPSNNEKITSPLLVKGIAPPGWVFEGQLVIKLLDENRQVIAQGVGKEDKPGNWTTGNPSAFEGTIPFSTSAKSGFVVIENDNPSGLPENQKNYEITVSF